MASEDDNGSRRSSGLFNPATRPMSRPSSGQYPVQTLGTLSLEQQTAAPPTVQLAQRNGYGTFGTPLKILVNLFDIDMSKMSKLLEYTLKIQSHDKQDSDIKGHIRFRIIYLLLNDATMPHQCFKYAASDYGSRLISSKPLIPPNSDQYIYPVDYFETEEKAPRLGERKLIYKVTIKQTQEYDIAEFRAKATGQAAKPEDIEAYTAVFNILVGRGPSQNPDMVVSGRRAKFFDIGPHGSSVPLGEGLEARKGFFRAVRPTVSGLKLNVHTATSVMIQQGMLHDVINAMARKPLRTLDASAMARMLSSLDRQLKCAKVEYQYLGHPVRKSFYRTAKVGSGLLPTAARVNFRRTKHPRTGETENKQLTVEQHFADAYPDAARYDKQSLVVNLGSAQQACYIPSALLRLPPGNLYLNLVPYPSQTKKMIGFACRPPTENQRSILDQGLAQLDLGQLDKPENRFSMAISGSMMSANARTFPAFALEFSSKVTDNSVYRGWWKLEGKKFKQPASKDLMKCSYFELLNPGMQSCNNLDNFLAFLKTGMKNYCNAPDAQMVTIPKFAHSRTLPATGLTTGHVSQVWQEMQKHGIKIVFVIYPDTNDDNRFAIKHSADVVCGMQTIGVLRNDQGGLKVGKGDISNLILKFNQKLGGVNWGVQPRQHAALKLLSERRVMMVGADVTHPSPGAMEGAPSYAAVVASTGPDLFQYPGCGALQLPDTNKKSKEIIELFGRMMETRLKLYQQRNESRLPEVIMVYRDGVADGMFAECVTDEVIQLRQACKKVYATRNMPKIVYLVAQKRHHIRFFRPDNHGGQGFDQKGNPNPGLVLDRDIVDGSLKDWYNVSHICIQGTSRPARYTALHDEVGLSPDEIQFITHVMCWHFGRCTRSISIHPAARYADLLCDRARVYLRSVYVPSFEDGGSRSVYEAHKHWNGHVHENLRDSMFYI